MTEEQKSLQWLSRILDILRKECPWDSVQTIHSLRYLTIEEVYELSEAISADDYDEMRKELGDLFMHLLFYSKIASDEGRFTATDVIDGICKKLIARHPHISLPTRDGVMIDAHQHEQPKWEQVKMSEGRHSALEGVPDSLPPLVKSIRMQEKAAGMGFDFTDATQAQDKATEEYNEFIDALRQWKDYKKADMPSSPIDDDAPRQHAEEELGDLLFAIVKWARLEGLNADDALMRANRKFRSRFCHVEDAAAKQNKKVSDLTLDQMVELWNEAKTLEIKH